MLHWHQSVKERQINQVDCRGLSLENHQRSTQTALEWSKGCKWFLWHFSSTDDFLLDILTLPLNKDKLVCGWEAHGEPDHDFIMSKLEK